MSECTSYSGSVVWEVVGVKDIRAICHLKQHSQLHFLVIISASVMIFGKISNTR